MEKGGDVIRLMRGPQPRANEPSEAQRRALAGLNRFQRHPGGSRMPVGGAPTPSLLPSSKRD
jgi:hypothetical protein